MNLTITAKIKILPIPEQRKLFNETLDAYKKGANFVSEIIYKTRNLVQTNLHKITYQTLREQFYLRSQMAQSVMKTVIARYKSIKSNKHDWSLVRFKKQEYDLVWNRDYSMVDGLFSMNTLQGRVKVPFVTKAMEHFFDGTWSFGTAKLVVKKGKYFLHIPMTKKFPEVDLKHVKNIVGVDMGLNFLAVSFNSKDVTDFFKGRYIKNKRAHYQRVRKSLQQKQTASARRRLKKISHRENRWMTHVNHATSKALVEKAGLNSLIVIENLEGIRSETEKVRNRDRWYTVSWTFLQLRQMIEYKAKMNQSTVIAVDPAYTSQTCPKCGYTKKANRNKKRHLFCCKSCRYTSNDDRIGAMNLHRKGVEFLIAETTEASLL